MQNLLVNINEDEIDSRSISRFARLYVRLSVIDSMILYRMRIPDIASLSREQVEIVVRSRAKRGRQSVFDPR
jgi:hypothetical protein